MPRRSRAKTGLCGVPWEGKDLSQISCSHAAAAAIAFAGPAHAGMDIAPDLGYAMLHGTTCKRAGEETMSSVRFSRHARRRVKLYGIAERTVCQILSEADVRPGRHEVAKLVSEHVLPVKVVYDVKPGEQIVITAYPLKRAMP